MKRNFTRAAALLLSLVMSMSLLAISAFAEENDLAQLPAADDSETVTLTEDVELSSRVIIHNNLTINLNGKRITQATGWSGSSNGTDYGLIQVMPGAELTITGTGTINSQRYVSGDAKGPLSAICAFGTGAKATISGNITATSDNIVLYAYRGGVIDASEGGRYTNTAAGYVGYNNGSSGNLTIAGKTEKKIDDKAWIMVDSAETLEIQSTSLSLEGNIGVNFYVSVPETVGDNVYIKLEGPNGLRYIPAKEPSEIRSNGISVFSYPVNATQMMNNVQASLVEWNGETYTEPAVSQSQSVQGYASEVEESASSDALKELTDAMMTFGGFARENFQGDGFNDTPEQGKEQSEKAIAVNTLVTEFDEADGDLKKQNITNNKAAIGGQLVDGVELDGVTLYLDSETAMRVYFTGKDEVIKGLRFKYYMVDEGTSGRQDATPEKKEDNLWYVEIPNIAAAELSKRFMIEVYEETAENYCYRIRYSPMTYVRQVLNTYENKNEQEDLVNLVKALYLYNQKAVEYFDS